MIIQIIAFILVFSLLVFVHELGHFIAARLMKVKVHEFAIGFGPIILAKMGKETKYSLRAFPLGGFVKMEGEDSKSDEPDSILKKSPIQKIFVFVSGALMNFVLAIILFWVIYGFYGIPSDSNVIGDVYKDYPAAKAGIIAKDKIVSINGEPISSWHDITSKISTSKGEISLKFQRNGKLMETKMTPIIDSTKKAVVGIVSDKEYSLVKSLGYSVFKVGDTSRQMLVFIGNIPFKGVGGGDVVGPVGIFQIIGDAATDSFFSVLFIMAILSINLGIFNLLPFPALDGGRIIISLVEMIRGKAIDPQKEGIFHLIGFAILLLLMVVLIINDTSRLIQ